MTITSRLALAAVAVSLGFAPMTGAFAQDKKDAMGGKMGGNAMSKDAMAKDKMAKGKMGKDAMGSDGMKKDEMKK